MVHYYIDESYFETEKAQSFIRASENGTTFFIPYEGGKATVWTAHLFLILTNSTFPLVGSSTTLNGRQFERNYIDGYKEGAEYFKNEYLINPNTLYTNPTLYVNNLHVCYFHKEPINRKKGWIKWKESYPILITEKAIKEYGFFAGVLFELNKIMEKHSALFIDFDKCPEGTTKYEAKALKSPVIALFTYLVNEVEIMKKGEAETVEAYCKAVCERYNLIYTDKVRQNFSVSKNKANISKVRKLILPEIDESSRRAIIEYLDNKADTKQKLYG